MNRRRADLTTERWKPKRDETPREAAAENDALRRSLYLRSMIGDTSNISDPATRRAHEIELIVKLARDVVRTSPAYPVAAILWLTANYLAELSAETGRRIEAPEPEAGTSMARFIAAMEATTDRALAAGLHPPNVAAVLREEAERAEGGKA